MKLKKIINDKNYKKLFTEYLKEKDILNVIDEIGEIENVDINKLFFLYKMIYIEKKSSEQNISFNLIYKHHLTNHELFSWLLVINDKSERNWDNIYYKICEEKTFCWKKVFEELIDYNSNHRIVIERIFTRIIKDYNIEHIKGLEYTHEKIILVCLKLNYLMNIYPQKLLEFFEDIININCFTVEEISRFLSIFLFNYPYVAKKYIESEKIDKNTILYSYIDEYIKKYSNDQEKIMNTLDLKGYNSRIIEYEKRKAKQQEDIQKKEVKYSFVYELLSHETFMYGNDIAYIRSDGTTTFSKLKKFESSVSFPIGYIIDPIKYQCDSESILNKKIGDE